MSATGYILNPILENKSGRPIYISMESESIWNSVKEELDSSSPSFNAVNLKLALQRLRSAPAVRKLFNQEPRRESIKEYGFEIEYIQHVSGAILVESLGVSKALHDLGLIKIIPDKEGSGGFKQMPEKVNELNLQQDSDPLHIAVCGVNNLGRKNFEALHDYSVQAIDRGHPSYKVTEGELTKPFYIYNAPDMDSAETTFIGRNKKVGAQEVGQLIQNLQAKTNMRLSAREDHRFNSNSKAHLDKVAQQNDPSEKEAVKSNAIRQRREALPDPVVAWTALGAGASLFTEAMELANQRNTMLDFKKAHHVHFSGPIGSRYKADKAIRQLNMEWAEVPFDINKKNYRQLDMVGDIALKLKRGRAINADLKSSGQVHPGFDKDVHQVSLILEKSGLVLKAGSSLGATATPVIMEIARVLKVGQPYMAQFVERAMQYLSKIADTSTVTAAGLVAIAITICAVPKNVTNAQYWFKGIVNPDFSMTNPRVSNDKMAQELKRFSQLSNGSRTQLI